MKRRPNSIHHALRLTKKGALITDASTIEVAFRMIRECRDCTQQMFGRYVLMPYFRTTGRMVSWNLNTAGVQVCLIEKGHENAQEITLDDIEGLTRWALGPTVDARKIFPRLPWKAKNIVKQALKKAQTEAKGRKALV